MTKRQYLLELDGFNSRKSALEAIRDDIINNEKEEFFAGLNDIHDSISNIEKEIVELDGQYRRRKWNSTDYQSYELVSSNID